MNKNNDWKDAANMSGAGAYVPHTTITTSEGDGQYIPTVTKDNTSSESNWIYYPSTTDTITTVDYDWNNNYYWYTTPTTDYVQDYSVFELPKKEMPPKVFIGGKMMTTGDSIGSKAQVVYDGSDKLIIRKNAMSWDAESVMYMSLEYKTKIYHFCVNMLDAYKDDTLILNAHKISKVNL